MWNGASYFSGHIKVEHFLYGSDLLFSKNSSIKISNIKNTNNNAIALFVKKQRDSGKSEINQMRMQETLARFTLDLKEKFITSFYECPDIPLSVSRFAPVFNFYVLRFLNKEKTWSAGFSYSYTFSGKFDVEDGLYGSKNIVKYIASSCNMKDDNYLIAKPFAPSLHAFSFCISYKLI